MGTPFPPAEVVLRRADVEAGLDQLAKGLQVLIDEFDCVLLGVLNGGLYPLMRLADRLDGNFLIDCCHATRYQGGRTGGELEWLLRPSIDLKGRTVIVIDDIWDEGLTLTAVADYCAQAGAMAVATAVLLVKDRKRPAEAVPPDFDAGLSVPDRYVFGCGMDLDYRWRHLHDVYALLEDGEQEGAS